MELIIIDVKTDFYIKSHLEYLEKLDTDSRLKELNRYDTIYDHMHFYFTDRIDLSVEKSIKIIDDFRTDMVLSGALEGH